jgi:hypothetical protein
VGSAGSGGDGFDFLVGWREGVLVCALWDLFYCEPSNQRGKYSRVLPLAQNLALGRVEEGE